MSAQVWSYEQKVLAHDRDSDDGFGRGIDIYGDLAIVGAPYEDHDSLGNNFISDAGSAYIYQRDSVVGWQLVQKIVPSDRHSSDFFGFRAVIRHNFAIVSAPQNDAVYVFEPDSIGYWHQIQKITGSDMGSELEILGDSIVAIGASRYGFSSQALNTGAVYLYRRGSLGIWTQSQLITSVSVNGGRFFGSCISFNDNILVVGAPFDNSSVGSASIFLSDSTGQWSVVQKLSPSNNSSNGYFGNDIAVSEKLLVIAQSQYAHNSFLLGAIYIYKKDSTGIFQEMQWLIPYPTNQIGGFGKEVLIHENQILVGSPNSKNPGLVIVYEFNSSSKVFEEFQRLIPSDPGFGGGFGTSCAVDKGQLVVNRFFDWVPNISGSGVVSYAGSVYFYDICQSHNDTLTVNSCGIYTSPSGKSWNSSGFYSDTVLSQHGCDSIIHVNLTVNEVFSYRDTITTCTLVRSPSGRYIWRNSGTYKDTLSTQAGCDSIVTTHLKVLKNDTSYQVETCYSYTSPNGSELTSSAIITDTLINNQGCDSIIMIDLKIYYDVHSFMDTTVCESFKSPSGVILNSEGLYTDIIPNSHGCDSVISIQLGIDTLDIGIDYFNGVLSANLDSIQYQWLDCDSAFSKIQGEVGKDFIPSNNGRYAVYLQGKYCSDTSMCITVNDVSSNELLVTKPQLYPNPTDGELTINSGASQQLLQVSIIDLTGKTVIQIDDIFDKSINLELWGLEPGVYYIFVAEETLTSIFKLIRI